MRFKSLALLLAFTTLVLPSAMLAESKKRQADRELASELSASLAVVASEGRKFARARDELARARLRNMQGLENTTQWVQEGNDFDLLAWEAIGEAYRLRLFRTVMVATDDIAARRAATAKLRAQQHQELSSVKSDVDLKTAQLLAVAGSLATLAEPPPSGAAVRAMLTTTLDQLTASLGEENPKLKQGMELAGGLLDKVPPSTP